MHLTHLGHSCVLVEIDGTRILFDPGTLSSGFEQLTDLDAILITHQHPDHADVARLPALVAANPDAQLHCDPQTAAQLAELGTAGQWQPAHPGDQFDIGPVHVRVTGGDHAVIHPDIPIINNAFYLLDTAAQRAAFGHPGDSLFVPDEPIDVLAIPAAAPWLKISESVDYLRAVAPRVAVPIHQAVLSPPGVAIHHTRLDEMKPAPTTFLDFTDGNRVEV